MENEVYPIGHMVEKQINTMKGTATDKLLHTIKEILHTCTLDLTKAIIAYYDELIIEELEQQDWADGEIRKLLPPDYTPEEDLFRQWLDVQRKRLRLDLQHRCKKKLQNLQHRLPLRKGRKKHGLKRQPSKSRQVKTQSLPLPLMESGPREQLHSNSTPTRSLEPHPKQPTISVSEQHHKQSRVSISNPTKSSGQDLGSSQHESYSKSNHEDSSQSSPRGESRVINPKP